MKKILKILIGSSTITNGIMLLTGCNVVNPTSLPNQNENDISEKQNNLGQESKSNEIEQLKKEPVANEEEITNLRNQLAKNADEITKLQNNINLKEAENQKLRDKVAEQNESITSLNNTLKQKEENEKNQQQELEAKNKLIEQLKYEKKVLTFKAQQSIEYFQYQPLLPEIRNNTIYNPYIHLFPYPVKNVSWEQLKKNFESELQNLISSAYYTDINLSRQDEYLFQFKFFFTYSDATGKAFTEKEATLDLSKPIRVTIISILTKGSDSVTRTISFWFKGFYDRSNF